MEIKRVGLYGYAGVGKDTAALGLIRLGWKRIAVADQIRGFLEDLQPSCMSLVREHGWEWAKRHTDIRAILDRCGAAIRKRFPGALFDATRRLEDRAFKYVWTDVRTCCEYFRLKSERTLLVRIDRPGHRPLAVDRELIAYPFHRYLVNDGTEEELQLKLWEAVYGSEKF